VIALLNRVGDRILRTVLPQAEAAAVSCFFNRPVCSRCYGSYCVSYYVCGPSGCTAPDGLCNNWCYVSAPGASGLSYSPCPC
jgi:hypothetical protein